MPRVIDARRPKGHQRLYVRYLTTRIVNGQPLGDSEVMAYEIQTRPIGASGDDSESAWTLAGWACAHPKTGRNWIGVDTQGAWTRWRSTRTEIAEDVLDDR
jgi:hypothetical protein